MRLRDLLDGAEVLDCRLAGDVEISGLCYDTMELRPGDLFVALPGYKTDGHKYMAEAMALIERHIRQYFALYGARGQNEDGGGHADE